jgi:hypothetical protein
MVGCNNSADGLNRKIHYSSELVALQAEKREIQGTEHPDLNDNMALPAREQFEGLESTTRRTKRRGLPKHSKPGNRDPSFVKHGGTIGP